VLLAQAHRRTAGIVRTAQPEPGETTNNPAHNAKENVRQASTPRAVGLVARIARLVFTRPAVGNLHALKRCGVHYIFRGTELPLCSARQENGRVVDHLAALVAGRGNMAPALG
jgi:hypothetical protein